MGQVAEFPRVSKLSEIALKAMIGHGVPPTPHNYTVWFTHVSGLEVDLSREIDSRVAAHEPFTDQVMNDLYERFCDVRRHLGVLQQTSAELDHAVERVVQVITSAAGDTASFNKTLGSFTSELGAGITEDRVRTIVANLLVETQQVAEKGRTLEDKLSRASGEVAELRQNLEVVRREALTDPLTGIPNRKLFESRLREAARNAVETGEPMSLLMLDIDHFKRFNDSYGHQLGDRVLQLVARILKTSIKGRDMVARYGGEEFAVILPATRLAGAATLGDQIREAVATRHIIQKRTGEDLGTISLSLGVANLRSGDSAESLIKRADEALYAAKRNGRNRVVTEEQVGRPMAV